MFASNNKGIVVQFTTKKFGDSRELTPFNTVNCHTGDEIASMTVTKDSKYLFTSSKESLKQWDMLTFNVIQEYETRVENEVIFLLVKK